MFDCDDTDPDIHPGAAELCNTRDDDCDGAVDEGACGGGELEDGLLGYWPFDLGGEDLVAGRALDLAGGATIVTGPSALRGGALQLQTDDDYAVRSADDEDFDFGASDFTVQLWVSYDDLQGEQVLVEKFTGGSGPGWTLTRIGDSLQFYWWGGSVNTVPHPLVTHRYFHVVVRRAGPELQVFFDGAPMANAPISTIEGSANPLLVGRRNSGDPRGFGTRGRIDELAIWARGLSDTELALLFNGGLGHPLVP